MKKLFTAFLAISLMFAPQASAKVEGDTIVLGAAISLTGKYSTNGKHTKNGYDLATKRINDMGGVTVNARPIKSKSSIMMTNQRRRVPGNWPSG